MALLTSQQSSNEAARKYAGDPVGYAKKILKIELLTPEQEEILPLVHKPPYKVLVPSAHDVGKTFLMAVMTNYWYDCFGPSVVLSTAPTSRDVKDLLWTEIRLQRGRAGLAMPFSGPSIPYMGDGPEHFAKGFTAKKGEMFKGRHRRRMMFLFDEANEIDAAYWTVVKTMFDPADDHAWVAVYNPVTTTTQAYQECLACDEADGTPRWHLRRLSALNHPNVIAGLKGEPRPIPGAVSLEMVNGLVEEWCEPVSEADCEATDLEWPPPAVTGKPGKWYRPGAEFQSRIIGIEPDVGDGVWGPRLWEAVVKPWRGYDWKTLLGSLPEIGCDCAMGKGEDWAGIHGRWGPVSLYHETSNTMEPKRIFDKLIEACRFLADFANSHRSRQAEPWKAKDIPIKIDDDGTGGAVGSFLGNAGYNSIQVGAATTADDPERYANKRSELWFQTKERAKVGLVCLSHPNISAAARARLRQQLLAPKWELDLAGRRKVDPKDDIKELIGRSPDDADSFNLSHYQFVGGLGHHTDRPLERGRR